MKKFEHWSFPEQFIPVQLVPVPWCPVLHEQENDPWVFWHIASVWQLWPPTVHSLMSENQKKVMKNHSLSRSYALFSWAEGCSIDNVWCFRGMPKAVFFEAPRFQARDLFVQNHVNGMYFSTQVGKLFVCGGVSSKQRKRTPQGKGPTESSHFKERGAKERLA